MTIPFTQCKNMLLFVLSDYFSGFKHKEENIFEIENIKILLLAESVVLEWFMNPSNDAMADSIAMLIYQIQHFPNSDIFQHYQNQQTFCNYKNRLLLNYLRSKYGNIEEQGERILINWNGAQAELNTETFQVLAGNKEIRDSLEKNLQFFFSL